jgi:hypothetical protein
MLASAILDAMPGPYTFQQIEEAVRASFAIETCSPDDVNEWSEQNRSRGHCAVSSLTLHDVFGGELLCAEVHVDEERIGYHWWNRFGELEVDLTRDQFASHEIVGQPWVVERPPANEHFYAEQHEVFRQRVFTHLLT